MERSRTIRAPASRAAAGGRLSVVLAIGVLGALLLAGAELSTIAAVEIPGRTCREVADVRAVDRCSLSGFERHGGAFLLLGVLAAFLAVGAGRGRSRPAGAGLIAIAGIVLAIALLRDLPETSKAGAVGVTYEGASGKAGPGLYLETAAGVLLAGAGALALMRRPTPPSRPDLA
jgi:hypothetical protein